MKVFYESKREAMYRNIKYWGKKPHNIWNELIEENTKKGDVVFDPFLGSGVSFFESIKLDRIPVGVDINPLSSFIAEVYSVNYSEEKISNIFNEIKMIVEKDKNYKEYYKNAKCELCTEENLVSNYIWKDQTRIERRFRCEKCGYDNYKIKEENFNFLKPEFNWIPYFDLRELSIISENSINIFGGHNISDIYTSHNLYVNMLIFDEILKVEEPYRRLFVLIFLQMVHLTTKMCAVRSKKSNRMYSSSWGRPAFLALTNYMEQNPLIQLERSIYGNSGILSALNSLTSRIPKFELCVLSDFNVLSDNGFEVKKPTIIRGNSKEILLTDNSVDFIITDPPYGNIIQYGELGVVWNSWLRIAYPNYKINLNEEVVVNDFFDYNDYSHSLSLVFDNCYRSLKNGKNMIFTFNSNKTEDWIVLKNLLINSKFIIKSISLQQNLRASEANVGAKQGMAISDFYIKMKKDNTVSSELKIENNTVKLRELEKLWRY